MSVRAFLEDHVSPLPWLIVDQAPLMARSGVIHGQQDFTRMDREFLTAHGCKFEDTCQRKNVLRDRIIVPVKR